MSMLEEKILNSFIKYEGKNVDGLELFVAWCEDCWPDDDGIYCCEIMERQDNGKVWHCECTKNGNIKNTYML